MTRTVDPVVPAGTMANSEQPVMVVDSELVLRPWRHDDAAAAFDAFSDPDIQFWHSRRYDSVEHVAEWIDECGDGWRSERSATWAIVDRATDSVLGRVSIHTSLAEGHGEVSYWLLPPARGRGAATRAAARATQWAHRIGLHRVRLHHSTRNDASRKVALGAGFVAEGVQRQALLHADGWHDMQTYSHLAADARPADGRRSNQVVLGAINIEADDPASLARFWAEALGGTVESSSADFAFLSARQPDGFSMFLGGRTGARPQHQSQHLDLTVPWGTRVSEVARFTALGAEHQWDVLDEVPWVQWSTLKDPEGNLFCIAEHPPATFEKTHEGAR